MQAASSGGEEFERYNRELARALGDRDPIAVMRASLADVERITGGATSQQLNHVPGPGEWSPAQVLSHLADDELVWGVRLRMVLTHERPPLTGFDQDAWTARFAHLETDAQEALDRWRALRRSNLNVFESVTPTEWDRVGQHSERGEVSVREMARLLAGHDCLHIEQIGRGLGAV